MKRFVNIILIVFVISLVIALTSGIINYICPFKFLFHISCPGCGLTRAFRAIINFNFYSAFNYNILSIPLFFIGIIISFCMIIDVFKNSNKTIICILNFFEKNYLFVLFLIILSMFFNNIRGI